MIRYAEKYIALRRLILPQCACGARVLIRNGGGGAPFMKIFCNSHEITSFCSCYCDFRSLSDIPQQKDTWEISGAGEMWSTVRWWWSFYHFALSHLLPCLSHCLVVSKQGRIRSRQTRIKTISSHLAQHGTQLPVGAVAQPAPTSMAAMPFLQVRSEGSERADAPGLQPI